LVQVKYIPFIQDIQREERQRKGKASAKITIAGMGGGGGKWHIGPKIDDRQKKFEPVPILFLLFPQLYNTYCTYSRVLTKTKKKRQRSTLDKTMEKSNIAPKNHERLE
jgi:hypothetical protein